VRPHRPQQNSARHATTGTPPGLVPRSLADIAGFLLSQVAAVLRDRTARAVQPDGVQPRQLGLLFLLREAGAYSQQQLGERLGMDRTTTMQLVSALEAEGLVSRDDDPGDRRAYRLRLTSKGSEVTRRLADAVSEVERQTLKALTATERRHLKLLLRKVLESAPPGS